MWHCFKICCLAFRLKFTKYQFNANKFLTKRIALTVFCVTELSQYGPNNCFISFCCKKILKMFMHFMRDNFHPRSEHSMHLLISLAKSFSDSPSLKFSAPRDNATNLTRASFYLYLNFLTQSAPISTM